MPRQTRKNNRSAKRPAGHASGAARRTADRLATAAGLAKSRRYPDALAEYRALAKQFPRRADVRIAMAAVYGRLGREPDAERAYLEACSIAPDRADYQRVSGLALQEMGRHRASSACFARAAELEPGVAKNHALLAGSLERQHQLHDARQAVERALAADKNLPEALLVAAVIDRRNGDFDAAEASLNELLAGRPDATSASRANYELAQVFDRAGRYGDAMDALLAAKRILRNDKTVGSYRTRSFALNARFDEALETLSPRHFARWRAEKSGCDPAPVVLAGHPRSGTTLTLQLLDAHPNVIGLDEKHAMGSIVHNGAIAFGEDDEPTPNRLDRLPLPEAQRLRHEYWNEIEALTGTPRGDRVVIDKQPQLINYVPSIARVFPTSRLVVVVRDPRDVCLSCFMQSFPLNATSVAFLSLEGAMHHCARFMAYWGTLRDMLAGDWLEVRYEDLTAEFEPQARRLAGFVGLNWDDRMLSFHSQALQKEVSTPSYETVTNPINTKAVGRWENYADYFEPLLDQLKPTMEEFGYA